MNLYNAKVSFKGEGSFNFTMPYYGEVVIYAGKDIYMKNLTQQGVETLRTLRPMLLEHQLNAKPDGCFTYIDFNETNNIIPTKMQLNYRDVVSNKSLAEMKAEMIRSNGPIIEEPAQIEEHHEEITESKVLDKLNQLAEKIEILGTKEEPKEETQVDTTIDDYVLTSSKHKGKKISELSKAQLSGNLRRFNNEDLKVVKAYLDK